MPLFLNSQRNAFKKRMDLFSYSTLLMGSNFKTMPGETANLRVTTLNLSKQELMRMTVLASLSLTQLQQHLKLWSRRSKIRINIEQTFWRNNRFTIRQRSRYSRFSKIISSHRPCLWMLCKCHSTALPINLNTFPASTNSRLCIGKKEMKNCGSTLRSKWKLSKPFLITRGTST